MTDNQFEMIKEVMVQCHENLRAVDTKRDVIFGLYLTGMGTLWYNILNLKDGNDAAMCPALFASLVAGFFVFWLLVLYRGWHLTYSHSAKALSGLLAKKILPLFDKEIFSREWETPEQEEPFFCKILKDCLRAEGWISTGCLLMLLFNLFFLLFKAEHVPVLKDSPLLSVLLIGVLLKCEEIVRLNDYYNKKGEGWITKGLIK